MCGISLRRLKEIVTDQDHEEFLDALDKALLKITSEDEEPFSAHHFDDYLL